MGGKRLLIAIGAALALAVSLAVLIPRLNAAAPALAQADALGLAVRWLTAPGLCLLAGIGFTANRRFLDPKAIDGDRPAGDRAFDINLRYNQNTLEQTVLAAIAWLGLAAADPPRAAVLLPALAGLFAAGRLTFWLGYLYAPWARAFGLGLTFYPTVAILVWLGVRLFR
jgi:hypothetical protein